MLLPPMAFRTVFLFGVVGLLAFDDSAAEDDVAAPLPSDKWAEFQFLVEGIDTWYRDASFYCHFEGLSGKDATPEQVEHAVRDGIFDGFERTFWGIMLKSPGDEEGNLRYELNHENANVMVSAQSPWGGPQAVFRNRNAAEMMSSDVDISFDPHSMYARIQAVDRPEDQPDRDIYWAKLPKNPLSPLVWKGGLRGELHVLLEDSHTKELPDKTVTFDVTEPAPGRMELTCQRRFRERDFVGIERFVFATESPVPYPVEVESIVFVDGKKRTSSKVILRDFVSCPMVKLARSLTYTRHADDPPRTSCSVWISDDLGEREPTEADFAITIPEGAVYTGFKVPMDNSEERVLRLADFTANEASHREEPGTIQGTSPYAKTTKEPRYTWPIAIACIAIFAGFFVWLVRRRMQWAE